MENLNAEQVKEWLEICAEDTPYPDQRQALLDALSLINELTEENERLRKRNITLEQKLMILDREEVPVLKVQVKGE